MLEHFIKHKISGLFTGRVLRNLINRLKCTVLIGQWWQSVSVRRVVQKSVTPVTFIVRN